MSRKTSVIPRESSGFGRGGLAKVDGFGPEQLCKLRSRDRPTAAPAGSPSATTPPGSPTPTETALFRLARACCCGPSPNRRGLGRSRTVAGCPPPNRRVLVAPEQSHVGRPRLRTPRPRACPRRPTKRFKK